VSAAVGCAYRRPTKGLIISQDFRFSQIFVAVGCLPIHRCTERQIQDAGKQLLDLQTLLTILFVEKPQRVVGFIFMKIDR
jgi:hypothetical protein